MDGHGWIIVGLSVLLTGLSVALFLFVASAQAAGMRRIVLIKGRISRDEQSGIWGLLLADFCTNGVLIARLPTRYLGKLSVFARTADDIQRILSSRVPGCSRRAVAESLFSLSIACGLVSYVLTGQVLLAIASTALPTVVARVQTKKWLRARKDRLREQLPDALRGLGMCFMAGLSLEQAFDQTAQECREPLRSELRQTVNSLRTGSSIMESLDSLDARLSMDDMRFVTVALEIQHRTGGSMREVLDAAADSMLASFDLSRSLEVQTAQARMSARVVSILPVALVVVLSLTMEGYLATFFSSSAGLMLLLCAVGMQAVGILVIRKILDIDLE